MPIHEVVAPPASEDPPSLPAPATPTIEQLFPPTESEVVATVLPAKRKRFTKKAERDAWAMRTLPDKIQAELDQPFGKPSLRHSFYSEVCFRHVLLPLFKSGFLSRRARRSLETAYAPARWLQKLIREHRDVDFSALQRPISDTIPMNDMMESYSRMFTAAALHFDLEIPAPSGLAWWDPRYANRTFSNLATSAT